MNWSNPTKTPFSLKYSLKVNAHECQRQIYCEVWPRILLTLWSQTDFQVKFRCKEKSKERSESQKPVVFYVFVRGHKEWDNQRMRDKRDVETLSGPRQVTDTAPATCGVPGTVTHSSCKSPCHSSHTLYSCIWQSREAMQNFLQHRYLCFKFSYQFTSR